MACSSRYFRLAWLVSGVLVLGVAQANPTDWLMKINQAAAELSFSGVFVYSHGNQIEAMQVVRRVKDDMMQERLYSLNGEAREIVRDMNRVWCYIPDQEVGVHDFRQVSEGGFPRILPGDLNNLRQNYHFTEGGSERIADRMARQINVIPNDDYRYGYALWADMETGLLLRSDLLDQDREIVEQYQFVTIDVESEISDNELKAVTSKENLIWYGSIKPELPTSVGTSNWQFKQLPVGFQLSKRILRMSPMEATEVEHLIFTDGLSTVSIFIKQANDMQSSMEGPSRMGTVHAFRSTIESHRITVMGEVPAETVAYFAGGVVYTQ